MNALAPSSITTRDPKGLKFISIVEARYNKAGLTDEEGQNVNDTPGLSELIGNFIEQSRRTDKYSSEEVKSTWQYPAEYAPQPIIEQVQIIHKFFPELSLDLTMRFINEVMPNILMPETPGLWFWSAFPAWEKIGNTYNEAVERILKVLASTRTLYNYREGKLGSQYLKQQDRSIVMHNALKAQQVGDIIIVQSQFGLRHRGKSTRRAIETFLPNEVGHGWFSGASMMLTHPKREVCWEQLHTDLPGDKYSPGGDGVFSRAPDFSFGYGQLGAGTLKVEDVHAQFGSASFVLPQ